MNHHKLTPGTSQIERLVRALSPDSFKLDDRGWQDFITTAHRYAGWLTYYDEFNAPMGDWAGFWEQETLTYLAVLAALDTDQIRRHYEEIEIRFDQEMKDFLDPDNDACTEDPWPEYSLCLVEQIRLTARLIEQIYSNLYSLHHPLASILLSLIDKANKCDLDELEGALQKLISYNKAAAGINLRDCEYNMFYEVELNRPDTGRWGVVGLAQYHFIPAHNKLPEQEELRELFKIFFQTLAVLKSRAQADFGKELTLVEKPESEYYRIVQPHIALFITFLNLFRHVQDDMNELPAKHLRYYYEEVLGIARRPYQPDHAYLIFTLAKGVFDEFIAKGTLLIGGKDKNGKPLYYETLDDWRVTQAKVEEVLNTYIGAESIKAAKVVEKGTPLGKDPFRLFGDDLNSPAGEMGFAIASPQLLMQEGERTITVRIELSGPVRNSNSFDLGSFKVKYSTDSDNGFHEVNKLEAIDTLNKTNGFIVRPEVLPFLPIQRVEPARRIVSDIFSDLCEYFPSGIDGFFPPPSLVSIYAQVNTTALSYLNRDLYYQALSGIHHTTRFINQEEAHLSTLIGTDPAILEEKKSTHLALVELYFYRAYYHWSLLSAFAPGDIPDLRGGIPPGNTPAFVFFPDKDGLYQCIMDDLIPPAPGTAKNNAMSHYGASEETPDVNNKFAINRFTILALLARIYLQRGAAGDYLECLNTCVLLDTEYSLPTDPGNTAVLLDPDEPFENVKSSTEVIWAIETASYGTDASYFSFLGDNDSFGRASQNYFYCFSKGLKQRFKKSESLIADETDAPPTIDLTTTFTDLRIENLAVEKPDALIPTRKDRYSLKYFRNGNSAVIMIRYAEILLMKALSLAKLSIPDNSDLVKESLNGLRNRANVVPYTAGGDDITMNQINEEFCREMAFEGLRLFWMRSMGSDGGSIDTTHPTDLSKSIFPKPDPIDPAHITVGGIDSVILMNILLKNDAPPILPSKTLTDGNITSYPILYITFLGKDADSTISDFYNYLIKQKIEKVSIVSDVKGIQKNLISQNDFGVFDGTQRFYPFGPVPENGALCYIGCEEAFNKKLTGPPGSTKITFNWIEDDNVLLTHIYGDAKFPGYAINPQIGLTYLNNGVFDPVTLADTNLRASGNSHLRVDIPIESVANRAKYFEKITKYEPTLKKGFVKIELQGDFGHNAYPAVLSAATISAAQSRQIDGTVFTLSATNPLTNYIPKPPHTPSTNSITLDYFSEQEMEWEVVDKGIVKGIDQFFHLLPFEGFKKYIFGEKDSGGNELKPSLVYDFDLPPDFPKDEDEVIIPVQAGGNFYPSTLYIGLSGLDPSGALSLLFQAAEGSELAPDDLAPDIRWSYLRANNDWEAFRPEHILHDSTMGLTQSGILRFAIPTDISSAGNTMLNPALLWVRASLLETSLKLANAMPAFTAIDAQAIEVQFADRGNEHSHLANPQPEGSITKLALSRSVIKSVTQPLPSFDGRLPEDIGTEYFRRVSERLGHKDRAVTPGDYERLALEKYRAVITAKAIPHTRYQKREELKAPGFVTLAVIPLLRISPRGRRVSPRLPAGQLLKMEEYLREKTNLHVQSKAAQRRLQVLNPLYERMAIKAKIKFQPGDFNLFKTRAMEALNQFIAPWIDDIGQSPRFGRCIYRSQIIALLENLPFVIYVKELSIYVERSTKDKYELEDGYVIEPTTSRSILTTGIGHVIIPPDKNDDIPKLDSLQVILPDVPPAPVPDTTEPETNAGFADTQEAVFAMLQIEQQAMTKSILPPPEKQKTTATKAASQAKAPKPKKAPAPKPEPEENDLTIIEGIGPKIQEVLKAGGIKTWAELARTSQKKLKEMLKKGGPRFAPQDPATWPEQAALAEAGKMAELDQLKLKLRAGKR